MIRAAVAVAFILAAGPATADSCSLIAFKDDLPNCVKELQSKMFILQNELQTEQARNRLYGTIVCNLAHSLNRTSPSEDAASTEEAACAEVNERLEAAKKRSQKAKTARP